MTPTEEIKEYYQNLNLVARIDDEGNVYLHVGGSRWTYEGTVDDHQIFSDDVPLSVQ